MSFRGWPGLVDYVERHPTLLDTELIYAHWLWPAGAAALHLRGRFGWPVASDCKRERHALLADGEPPLPAVCAARDPRGRLCVGKLCQLARRGLSAGPGPSITLRSPTTGATHNGLRPPPTRRE